MGRMTLRWNTLAPRRRAAAVIAVAIWALIALARSAGAAGLPTVTVDVGASSVTVGGALQSGAVNVVSTSTKKETSVILFALKPGVSVAEVEAFVADTSRVKDPNNASKYGTIAFDVEANPSAPTEAQTNLQAGQYIVLTSEGEKPVVLRTSFTVAPAASPATLPTPEATVRSIDFAFRGPTTLHDGELVRFENEGFLVHMDIAFPVKSRAVARKVVKLLLAGKERELEKLVVGPPVAFAGPLSSGAFQQETVTAKPGWYVQACFMETQDGRDHTLLGMERIFKIVK
jgi:hypothetical protein